MTPKTTLTPTDMKRNVQTVMNFLTWKLDANRKLPPRPLTAVLKAKEKQE